MIPKGRISSRVLCVPVLNALLSQFPALVRQIDESHFGNANHLWPVPVRQQPVVGRPDQEIVESLAGHQALDRLAQAGFLTVADRAELGLSGEPARKQHCRPSQGPARRSHGDAVEQRFRGQRPRSGLASERSQEPLHVGEVGRSGHHLDAPAVALGTLDLVEDQVGSVLDVREEVLEHRQVRSLVTLHVGRREHEAGVP